MNVLEIYGLALRAVKARKGGGLLTGCATMIEVALPRFHTTLRLAPSM